MGAEIRKEKVTPRGTPDSTKPRKSGTAEHEQKGVTIPRPAARAFPAPSCFPLRAARARSGVKKDRTMPTRKTMRVSSNRILGTSARKKPTAEPRRLVEIGRASCRERV